MLRARAVVALAALFAALEVGIPPLIEDAGAEHSQVDFRTMYQEHLDHTNEVGGFPAGAARPIVVCNQMSAGLYTDALIASIERWNTDAGFQAFWPFGVGGLFGSCPGDSDIDLLVAFSSPNSIGPSLFTTALNLAGLTQHASLLWPTNWTVNNNDSSILRWVFTHELGHALSLPEAYPEGGGGDCGGGSASVMDTASVQSFQPRTLHLHGHL